MLMTFFQMPWHFIKEVTLIHPGPVRVIFNGQPAIDTGGVKRQSFSGLFEKLIVTTDLKLFEGPPT